MYREFGEIWTCDFDCIWLLTRLAWKVTPSVSPVCPSVRLSVRPWFHCIFWTNWPLTELQQFLCVGVMTTAHLGLKVKDTGQGQRSTRSVWPRSSIEASFSSLNFYRSAQICACCVKLRPRQQQCRSNIVECYKSNDSFDDVECCFDIVAGFGNNVERNFVLSTKSKQIEHALVVSTLSKGQNFAINPFDIVAVFGNKVERCFDIVAGVDGA